MASTSRGTNQSQAISLREVGNHPPNYHPYPPPLAEYSEVVANPRLFMSTLEKMHSTMGTKFMFDSFPPFKLHFLDALPFLLVHSICFI